ncbi:hypothetical protein P8C59_006782 [Phyllachora maydis]|uniref:SUN domain-containing protein n=1 Tax=Phyllachora maydis TaxID=1825666 RepID=A0AAD9I8C0_9PEZI|nr:hypothetical protein P8C59_006782 [Phyllachora maydis]
MLARKAAKGQQVQEDAGYVHGGDEDEDEELSQVGVEDFADEDIDMLRDEPDVQALNLWSLAAAALLSLALVWFSLMMRGFVQGHNSLHWYGLRDWHHNLGQFFPAVGHLSNDEYASLSHDLFKQSASVRGLGDRLDHTEAAVETLNNILPQVVHVKRSKTGQVVVADDFWHALKDLIEHDTSVFNTEQPMQRMQQMASNIEKQVQTVAGKTFSKSWESWLKNNQRKVGQILGQAWATELPDEVEKKILAYSEKVFNEKTAGSVLPPYVLKKEDFMAELDKALKAETKERSDELESLRRKVEEIATDTENIMSQQGKGGLSRSDRDEMRTMAEQVTRDAIARAQLDGTASSRIAKHLGHLDYKVNHFAVGNGPSVDEALTSPTFVAPERARASRPWWRSVLRFRPRSHAAAALTSWEEPGECWCAGNRHRDGRPRPVDMAVGLRTSIVPQHLVVEHIDPDTTVDGRAMPRDVEIWARIDDARSRDVATDYMRATWPGHQGDEPLLALGFVQIGAFTYEYSPQSKGSHVYRFPLDLVRIGAETDHVVVRALSNHGAGHTCFYRIRLYGEPREALLEE